MVAGTGLGRTDLGALLKGRVTVKKASDLFIECLEEEGVEYIFGVPGEENLDFLDSLSRSKMIKADPDPP